MKLFFATLLGFLFLFSAHAQELPLAFTVFNSEVYFSLSGVSSATGGEIWDDPENVVPIGFNFQLFGSSFSELSLFGSGGSVGFTSPEFDVHALLPYGSDIADLGMIEGEESVSNIVYATEGSAPDRIFKMEWENCGFYLEIDSLGTGTQTTNFQLWLFETTNIIEYRYGSNTISNPGLAHDFSKPFIGLIQGINLISGTIQGAWFLGGNPSLPQPAFANLANKQQPGPQHLLDSEPAIGQVYRFAPIIAPGLSEVAEADFGIFPTVTDDFLNINRLTSNAQPFIIRSLTGQTLLSGVLTAVMHQIEIDHLNSGVYLFSMGSETKRFVVR